MWTAAVGYHFYTVKAHMGMRTIWCEELFLFCISIVMDVRILGRNAYTCLRANTCIRSRNHCISKGNVRCSLQTLNASWEMILFSYSRLAPGSKMPHLSVVAIICKIHLGPDQEDFAVQADYSTIVSNISVLDGHYPGCKSPKLSDSLIACNLTSNVQQNIIAGLISQDPL